MTIRLLIPFVLLFLAATLSAQNRPTQARSYPAAQTVAGGNDALSAFDAAFDEANVGFLHVYAIDNIDPVNEDFIFRGDEMAATEIALLPKKIQKMAERKNATLYATAAIRGVNEAMYMTRMDADGYDRIDMFAIRDNEVVHLKTLASRSCKGSRCTQVDSWITDIDGDATLDLMQGEKRANGKVKKSVYVLGDTRKWVRTTSLDAPWDSADFNEEY